MTVRVPEGPPHIEQRDQNALKAIILAKWPRRSDLLRDLRWGRKETFLGLNQYWFNDKGRPDRLNGPAIIRALGGMEFWVDGIKRWDLFYVSETMLQVHIGGDHCVILAKQVDGSWALETWCAGREGAAMNVPLTFEEKPA